MGKHENLTGAQRAARRRDKLRAAGLRPIQLWVPDLRNPEVRAQLAREVEAINRSDAETGVMDFLESIRAEVWANEPDYDWGPAGPPEDDADKE